MEEKTENRKKIVRVAFVFQLILLAFFPVVNNEYNMWKITIWGLFALVSVLLFSITFFMKKSYKRDITCLIVAFAVINVISMIWGMMHDVIFVEAVRGVLPFVYFIYIYIIDKQQDWEWNLKYEWMIAVIGVIQAIEIIGCYIYYDCFHTKARVTGYIATSTRFVTILGVIYFFSKLIRSKKENKKTVISQIIAMLLCWIAIILTQTKSMLLAVCLGIFIVFCLNLPVKEGRKKVLIRSAVLAFVLAVVLIFSFSAASLGERWSGMFQEKITSQNDKEVVSDKSHYVYKNKKGETVIVSDSASRIYEVEAALENWKTSPILGKGCGYKWVNKNIPNDTPKRYMHNILAYFLMDYGIVGILWLTVFGIYLVWFFIKILRAGKTNEKLYLNLAMEFSVIITAFVYANFFAVFKTIDFIFVFAMVVGSYCVNCKKLLKEEKEDE